MWVLRYKQEEGGEDIDCHTHPYWWRKSIIMFRRYCTIFDRTGEGIYSCAYNITQFTCKLFKPKKEERKLCALIGYLYLVKTSVLLYENDLQIYESKPLIDKYEFHA